MPPLPSTTDFALSLTRPEQTALLALVRLAIESHWHPEQKLELVRRQSLLPLAQAALACFVTLHKEGELRGCIGCLEPELNLAEALPYYAQAAAFADPRFPPLQESELAACQISISLLSPLSPLPAGSRQELLNNLVPDHDGLWLQSAGHKATFLPAVWRELPEPDIFLNQLLRKGGWPVTGWPAGLKAYRYHALELTESESGSPA